MLARKCVILIIILSLTMIISFILPKTKYKSFDIIRYLDIPLQFNGWSGKPISNQYKQFEKAYNFISKSEQIHYVNRHGMSAYLSLLDAGNLHNPKTCYTSIGYQPQYLSVYNFNLENNKKLKLPAFLMQKKNNKFLTMYWICVNGKRVNWLTHKFNELLSTFLNKKRMNLMVRLDIPADPQNMDIALTVAKNFIQDLYSALDKHKAVYIFGE